MSMLDLLAVRRDGQVHTREQLRFLCQGAAKQEIPDYQLSAWLMAAFLNPLSHQETAWLTQEMAASGERIDLTGLPKPWVDKHSTGGVGDKTTIVLLPLLASCGVTMAKMSGRGLGITGGTIDKLASVPGFRLDLTPEELKDQAARIGVAITGQTPRLAPADKKLYALRDATATVASVPLIVSSVLSKKIAGGAETIVLDVKCGSGAFMPDLQAAHNLAVQLRDVGKLCGLNVWISITDMSQPLGSAVGNALEVKEALCVLANRATPVQSRFRDLCIALGAETLVACGKAKDLRAGEAQILEALGSGSAWEQAKVWFAAQGCTIPLNDLKGMLPQAPIITDFVWDGPAGFVERVNALVVGQVVVGLGGGREHRDDVIDPSVGIESMKSVGDAIQPGETVFKVHAASTHDAERAKGALRSALAVVNHHVKPIPLILQTVRD
ncbi:MAG: thymidine phosphorylase [Fimbriimonadaceae bacterium]|nr:thymidine phosphorylase [Fimbriimonadaceae bacterium]